MKNAIRIHEAYVENKKRMVLLEKGILSLDSASAINALRKANAAEKKDLEATKKNEISKSCKSK